MHTAPPCGAFAAGCFARKILDSGLNLLLSTQGNPTSAVIGFFPFNFCTFKISQLREVTAHTLLISQKEG
ncbi:hypothetical transcript [Echinococcus multilocularis]|uniref:Hypothetical transcript n=1 Tax=Echinococcus multilocularis TaxID=6211 RepID=A0A0S4MMR5_ECHMU|nr:hypothetical transcript [Echinococcus multilocularis]